MERFRIILAASEAVPYAKTGGLADVAGALPKALADLGHDVAVVMPRYHTIHTGQPIIHDLHVPFAGTMKFSSVWYEHQGNVPYYFIDAPEYFFRNSFYGEQDDMERFAYFSRAVLESLRRDPPRGDQRLDYELCSLVKQIGRYVHPSLAGEVASGWPKQESGWPNWDEAVDEFLALLQFRKDMLEEITR